MKTIDYRKQGWGHAVYTYGPDDESHDFTALAINAQPIREGDYLLWETNYGYAEVKVVDAEWKVDPSDMYRLKLVVSARYDHNSNKL